MDRGHLQGHGTFYCSELIEASSLPDDLAGTRVGLPAGPSSGGLSVQPECLYDTVASDFLQVPLGSQYKFPK